MKWIPQPGPQSELIQSEVFEVIYGGARGGGKTDGILGEFALHASRFGADAKGLLVRRTRTALEPTVARAREIYAPLGATWRESRSRFEWPSGAVLYFRFVDNDADADLYQGHDYTRVYVEELTQFPRPGPIDKLKGSLRSAAGVRCAFRATCNPGGPGHAWVKARYIDPGPRVIVREAYRDPFGGPAVELDRQFIPARLSDNRKLLESDPDYVGRLQQTGSAELVRAWLEGDWDIIEGAFFDKWSVRNVIGPFALPPFWTRFRAFDWGYASPFSVGWWAVVSDDFHHPDGVLPRGALVRYREWYGASPITGAGVRLEAEGVADGILEREAGEAVAYGVADPSIFSQNGGPSIFERMVARNVVFRRADNTRVPEMGALGGWDQMRARILGDGRRPMLYVFETCRDFIRTVPVLQHDAARPEDVDTEAEDHIADETRYACLSRPLIAAPPVPPPTRRLDWDWAGMRQRLEAANWKIV